jgi:hypothetical protein
MPCINRKRINKALEGASPQSRVVSEKMTIPVLETFLIPLMSPHRPTGSKNIADASKNAVSIQLSDIALMLNSFSIVGSAMLIDETTKELKKDVTVTIASIDF